MTPVYDADGLTLFQADVREVLVAEPARFADAQVLLTDPPYAAHKYIKDLETDHALDFNDDARWAGEVFRWVGTWWWPLRQQMAPDAVAWVFCNVHYLGFYLRWAHLTNWPLRGIFACPPNEFLLSLGAEPLTPEAGVAVRTACQANTYGQNKPLALLRTLLATSPPGLVIEPFAGHGSTLQAARLEGRAALGAEIRPELAQQAVTYLEGA